MRALSILTLCLLTTYPVVAWTAKSNVPTIQPVVLAESAWKQQQVDAVIAEAIDIFNKQCGISLVLLPAQTMATPGIDDVIDEHDQTSLLGRINVEGVVVVFIERANDQHQAYSYLRSAPIRSRATAWITQQVSPSCLARTVAHELGHILLNQAKHESDPRNLMHGRCIASNITGSVSGVKLQSEQCRRLFNPPAQFTTNQVIGVSPHIRHHARARP